MLVCVASDNERPAHSLANTASGSLDILSGPLAKMSGSLVAFSAQDELFSPQIDHLGIAVHSIEAAWRFYELLGMEVTHRETVEHEQVHTAMLPVGESRLELLEPTTEDSVLGRFLARRGEGLHHIALRVTGLDERFRQLQSAGVRLASDSIRVGAGGHRYFFVHPGSTGGVLVELVEAAG